MTTELELLTTEVGPLRAALEAEGGTLTSLTVLSTQVDPFRVDTAENHHKAAWLAETMSDLGLTGQIHNRGLHYVLLGRAKPNGSTYANTAVDWVWLQDVSKAARWLGYVAFDQITDERNEAPTVRLWKPPQPLPYVSVDFDVSIPDAYDLEPYAGITEFTGTQPYHLALVGEKSSLDGVLGPISSRYQTDLYLPTGNISNTMVHTLAKTSAQDGRPLIVLYFADCDPSGWNMAIEVARKLQAFKIQLFPELEFQCYRVGLTPDQVREYSLPVSPVKETDKRRDKWMDATGVEQTEIDALATLQPNLLRQIAQGAIKPFYDHTLEDRVHIAWAEWNVRAQTALDAYTGDLDDLRANVAARLAEKRAEIEQILNTVRVDVAGFDLPEIPEIPAAVIQPPEYQPPPLCDSAWNFAEQCRQLKASKNYENPGGDR